MNVDKFRKLSTQEKIEFWGKSNSGASMMGIACRVGVDKNLLRSASKACVARCIFVEGVDMKLFARAMSAKHANDAVEDVKRSCWLSGFSMIPFNGGKNIHSAYAMLAAAHAGFSFPGEEFYSVELSALALGGESDAVNAGIVRNIISFDDLRVI